MTGHEDGLAGPDAQRHLGRHRGSERLGVGFVEQFHGLVVDLAAAKDLADPGVQIALVEVGEIDQGLDEIVIDTSSR